MARDQPDLPPEGADEARAVLHIIDPPVRTVVPLLVPVGGRQVRDPRFQHLDLDVREVIIHIQHLYMFSPRYAIPRNAAGGYHGIVEGPFRPLLSNPGTG